jgi:hypothetical protein
MASTGSGTRLPDAAMRNGAADAMQSQCDLSRLCQDPVHHHFGRLDGTIRKGGLCGSFGSMRYGRRDRSEHRFPLVRRRKLHHWVGTHGRRRIYIVRADVEWLRRAKGTLPGRRLLRGVLRRRSGHGRLRMKWPSAKMYCVCLRIGKLTAGSSRAHAARPLTGRRELGK